MVTRTIIAVLAVWVCVLTSSYALNNGLARTPPMGWNSWDHFGCDTSQLNQWMFMEQAQAMVSSGMAAAGYEYINMDDCWLAKTRDENGNLQPDPERFPDGIAYLADYVHSLGLKFGIYEDTSNWTCGGYPGSQGHYLQDAKTFASWGVDYVKLDGCYTNVSDMKEIYTQYGQFLNQTGRPMVYSCSWPAYANLDTNLSVPYSYVASICNLWRYYWDIRDSWDRWLGILDYTEEQNLAPFAGPGNWNDPDMLEIGNGNSTNVEYRALFSIWSILAAPLIAGNDLRNMTLETIELYTAPEVIAVDQDPLGKQGSRVAQNGLLEVWARDLADGSVAVALFNRGESAAVITAEWTTIGLEETDQAVVRDLWLRADLGNFTGSFAYGVDAHGAELVKITKL